MRITRFAQSCVLIETNNKRILVDPGKIMFEESLLNKEWSNIDVLLITHKHHDHFYLEAIEEITKYPNNKFYTSQEVAKECDGVLPKIVRAGDVLDIDDVRIEVVVAVHGYKPGWSKDKEINENIGFIIDDGNKLLYLTSDTIAFKNNYKCDVIFVPITNHGIVMGSYEAALFAKEVGAELVIPNHYDNQEMYPVSLNSVREEFDKQRINYKILDIRESLNFN